MSTYSDNLRIELITNGTQAGTWGDTTNTNLGTVIEDSIAGYATVSVISANQAFTTVDGAADQARNAMIALTTTTGADFAVYAPPYSKQYVIYNASSYIATIYNSTVQGNTTAAGVGIAIPAGKTMTVWTDGTDFRVQNSHLISNLVGNVTGNVTGDLDGNLVAAAPTAATQVPGTNNTTIATTAFVTAAVSASQAFPSGTSLVFAQTAAPTGWTKSTTHNDKALRVVSGSASSGGTTAFSTVFANQTPTITTSGLSVDATTLSTTQMPSHSHTVDVSVSNGSVTTFVGSGDGATVGARATASTGGGGSHTHSISGTATSSAITLDVQYVDVIIATKD